MNVEGLFRAVREEPDQHTLIVAVRELERQGYGVRVNERYEGSAALIAADERGELNDVPSSNGYVIKISKNNASQVFRIHILDNDDICVSSVDTSPVMYNPEFTTRFFRSGKTN